MLNRGKFWKIIEITGLLSVGLILGLIITPYLRDDAQISQIRGKSSEYPYINPLLLIDNSNVIFEELDPLKEKIENYATKKVDARMANSISVYYREINSGKWTGYNPDELYSPASMLKVTTLIANLKSALENENFLNKKLYYHFQVDPGQNYQPTPLKDGYYNRSALLQQMVINSDNTAMDLVQTNQIDEILKVYEYLDMPDPTQHSQDFLSPKDYSRIFRVLYNSSYLSRSVSNQVLQLLTHTKFNNGLRQGVPSNIEIAHKFGEFSYSFNGEIKYRELHDCGIVYSQNPYFICVMTKGQSFAELESIIGDISKIAFEYNLD